MKSDSALGSSCPTAVAVTLWMWPEKLRWTARYLKEVDADEVTRRFWQEIYDENGQLVEVHEKYPVDKGHQKV